MIMMQNYYKFIYKINFFIQLFKIYFCYKGVNISRAISLECQF